MITLRMFTEPELGHFDADTSADDVHDFFGLRSSHAVRRQFAENGLVDDDGGLLAIDRDGEVIGTVSWRATRYGPRITPPSFNVGISLVPSQRGQGHGTTAQVRLAEYLFATYPVNRLDAHTDVANVAEQRSLTKSGFTREGVLRGAQFRRGRYRDIVVYSRLRDDAMQPE